MIFGWRAVPAPARGVRVRVPGVVVPHRPHVSRVRLEEKAGHGVDASRLRATDRAGRRSGRIVHRPLNLMARPTLRAREVVRGHVVGVAEA